MMLFLMPQSTATMRGLLPALNTRGTFSDTSATRFRRFGSSIATGWPTNSILPSSEPFSRIFFVSMRVSMPYSAGMLCSYAR